MIKLGYDYPSGAAEDPNAPWNEQVCDVCGYTVDSLDEESMCKECIKLKEEELS